MLSALYALLEGLSREMGIERTDIKGCLFYTSVDGCMIFSVVYMMQSLVVQAMFAEL